MDAVLPTLDVTKGLQGDVLEEVVTTADADPYRAASLARPIARVGRP